MTGAIRIDHLNKKILISKSFAKASMNANSAEYKDLIKVLRRHPDYEMEQRIIRKSTNKETYAGLTYQYMRDYIVYRETPETAKAVLNKLEEMIFISQCHAHALRYPNIKKWFLEKYPEIDDFPPSLHKKQREEKKLGQSNVEVLAESETYEKISA